MLRADVKADSSQFIQILSNRAKELFTQQSFDQALPLLIKICEVKFDIPPTTDDLRVLAHSRFLLGSIFQQFFNQTTMTQSIRGFFGTNSNKYTFDMVIEEFKHAFLGYAQIQPEKVTTEDQDVYMDMTTAILTYYMKNSNWLAAANHVQAANKFMAVIPGQENSDHHIRQTAELQRLQGYIAIHTRQFQTANESYIKAIDSIKEINELIDADKRLIADCYHHRAEIKKIDPFQFYSDIVNYYLTEINFLCTIEKITKDDFKKLSNAYDFLKNLFSEHDPEHRLFSVAHEIFSSDHLLAAPVQGDLSKMLLSFKSNASWKTKIIQDQLYQLLHMIHTHCKSDEFPDNLTRKYFIRENNYLTLGGIKNQIKGHSIYTHRDEVEALKRENKALTERVEALEQAASELKKLASLVRSAPAVVVDTPSSNSGYATPMLELTPDETPVDLTQVVTKTNLLKTASAELDTVSSSTFSSPSVSSGSSASNSRAPSRRASVTTMNIFAEKESADYSVRRSKRLAAKRPQAARQPSDSTPRSPR